MLDVQVICRAGSLRKAAVTLGITQPTLSTRIARLEDQLGASLFDRSRGQSRPTALAEFIAARAATITTDASLLSLEVARIATGQAGLVRLGLGPAPMKALVAPLVAGIRAQHPDINIEILTGNSPTLRGWLLDRALDIVLSAALEPDDPAIAREVLFQDENVILAHPDHPMFRASPRGIREVFQYPAALPFLEPRYAEFARTHFGIDVEKLPGRMVCSDFAVLAQVTADAPHFFTAGPRFAFAAEIASGRLRVLDTKVPQQHLVLMHTNQRAFPLPAVGLVQDLVRSICAKFAANIP